MDRRGGVANICIHVYILYIDIHTSIDPFIFCFMFSVYVYVPAPFHRPHGRLLQGRQGAGDAGCGRLRRVSSASRLLSIPGEKVYALCP